MKYTQLAVLLTAALPYVTLAHMQMSSPAPRRSLQLQGHQVHYNTILLYVFNHLIHKGNTDYSYTSPLNSDGSNFPCKAYPAGTLAATYAAGQTVHVQMGGTATHGGGHCQWSLSYDNGKTFVVLRTIINDCFKDGLGYDVTIPAGAPPCDNCIFAWSWVNAIGNREFYMNCADVKITGSGKGFSGPKMTVANLPGYDSIGEFSQQSNHGVYLYENVQSVTIGGQSVDTPTKQASQPANGAIASETPAPPPPTQITQPQLKIVSIPQSTEVAVADEGFAC